MAVACHARNLARRLRTSTWPRAMNLKPPIRADQQFFQFDKLQIARI